MRRSRLIVAAVAVAMALPACGLAQGYSIDWYKIAGGGGRSVGGNYALSGTIGQHDASGVMSGGRFSLTGGFWSIVVVQSAGVPNLIIQYLGPDTVKISWPDTGSYTLRQSSDLPAANWTASGYSVTTADGTNSVTITPPVGNVFFRLSDP